MAQALGRGARVASSWRVRARDAQGHLREGPGFDRGTQPPHQVEIKVQIVMRREPRAEDLVALLEMAQVRTRVVAARVAWAAGIDRACVVLEARVADVDRALAR